MLAFPLATVTTENRDGRAGENVRITTVTPTRWTFDTCHRLGKAGFDMGFRAIRNEGSTTGNELEREENWMIEDFLPPRLSPDVTLPHRP